MRGIADCLMPDDYHRAPRPLGDGDLSRWMHRMLTASIRRSHRPDRGRAGVGLANGYLLIS